MLLSRTGHKISGCGWMGWAVSQRGLGGEDGEAGEVLGAECCGPAQGPWAPPKRAWSGQTWLLKGSSGCCLQNGLEQLREDTVG